jgi:BirA family biotin operon repressor/biotin-[acetyl-CoA-carboxylase] ligase
MTGRPSTSWTVERLDEVDSTNRYALEQAKQGARAGLVVVADHQTSGRGRLDRSWEAPPGSSLLVSVLLDAADLPIGDHAAVIATAVALSDAVHDVAGLTVSLKWPNDLVVSDRKLAGILAESDGAALVVGAGCNVNWVGFPDDLAATATACNLEVGHDVDRDALLDAFLARLSSRLEDPATTIVAYRDRLATVGRRVRVDRGNDTIVGDAVALTDAGALVVLDDESLRHEIVVGDVVHLRHTS